MTRERILSALEQATYEDIRSEYKRRIAGMRKTLTGGTVWAKHKPNAPRGCRCAKCWDKREQQPA